MTTRALLLTQDLMSQSKVTSHPHMHGFEWSVLSNVSAVVQKLQSETVALCVIDLECQPLPLAEIMAALQQHSSPCTTLAFGPHVRVDLLKQARQAGIEHVVPRSQLEALLASLRFA